MRFHNLSVTRFSTVAAAILLCLLSACASSSGKSPSPQEILEPKALEPEALRPEILEPEQPRTRTIVHDLLEDELRFRFECQSMDGSGWYGASKAALDDLLEQARQALNALGVSDWRKANRLQAERALSEVDRLLTASGYAVCIKTNLLSSALSAPMLLSSPDAARMDLEGEGRPCSLIRHPAYRDMEITRRWLTGLRPLDGDTGALLYLAIAEQNAIPLTFVEVSGHHFVRWHLPDGTHFNWDNNDAMAYTDDDYRQAKPQTAMVKFDAEAEKRNGYLLDMTADEVRAYYAGLIVGEIKPGFGTCVEELFVRSRPNIGSDAQAQNNFAWAFATLPEFEGTPYARMSVDLAERATSLEPGNCEFWDTLSCAYAAVGEFDEAIRVEREHISEESLRIVLFRNLDSCYQPAVAGNGGC